LFMENLHKEDSRLSFISIFIECFKATSQQ